VAKRYPTAKASEEVHRQLPARDSAVQLLTAYSNLLRRNA